MDVQVIEYAVSKGPGTLTQHALEAVGTSDFGILDGLAEGETMVCRVLTEQEVDEFVEMHGGSLAI
jgi:hypothetical protein